MTSRSREPRERNFEQQPKFKVAFCAIAVVCTWGFVAAQYQAPLPALETQFQTSLPDSTATGKVRPIALKLVSEVKYSAAENAYRYSYTVHQGGTPRLRILWRSVEESPEARQAMREQRLSDSGSFSFLDKRLPRINRFGVELYGESRAGDELLLKSPAAAYVPTP